MFFTPAWRIMATGEAWSEAEVRATVSDYMQMLQQELKGQAYSKTTHRRALTQGLDGRSDASIELKHQNISAVLQELGWQWISGYKPRGNYQLLLAREVSAWLRAHSEFEETMRQAVDASAVAPGHIDFGDFIERHPRFNASYGRTPSVLETAAAADWTAGLRRDYLAREARNSALGRAGEELALRFERERLSRLGHERLAGKVEHVAHTQGDGLGFDILSFEPDGRERFIEVKTTAFAKETPFFASSSEVEFARINAAGYHLYRLFRFKRDPKCFILDGVLETHCALDPVSFRCSFRAS